MGGLYRVLGLKQLSAARRYTAKREETLREDLCGREDLVYGLIPHQLVPRLVQPVHQFGVAGGPIVREHSTTFHCNLEMPDLTHLGGRLARARRTRAVSQTVGRTGKTYRNRPFVYEYGLIGS